MAKTLKHAYAGTPHRRVINAGDPNLKEFAGHKKTEWNPGNNHTAEVADEVGQWLLDNEPGDWELVDGDDGDASSSSSSGDDEDLDGSTDDGTAPITTGRKRPRPS